MSSLTNAKIRELKAKGQHLDPVLKIGKEGLTPQFFAALAEAFRHHELLKVKFADHKDEKKLLVPQIVEKSGCELIMRVGNVAVLYKPQPVDEEPAGSDS